VRVVTFSKRRALLFLSSSRNHRTIKPGTFFRLQVIRNFAVRGSFKGNNVDRTAVTVDFDR